MLVKTCIRQKFTRVFLLKGRSMGGRVAAECARKQTASMPLLLGVFCISFPLHKPKQKDAPRTSHLKGVVEAPLLIINGTKDAMCDYKLMNTEFKLLQNSCKTMEWVEDADHSLTVRGKQSEDVLNNVCKSLVGWCLNCVYEPETLS